MDKIDPGFVEAHQLYLDELDKAYDELKFYASDPDVLNEDWPKYKQAKERFSALLGDILLFKSVWYEVRELKDG
jgi:hypothetical protein